MSAKQRAHLAECQARLVAALVAGGPPPEGFDRRRLALQAAALVARRQRLVAGQRPDVALELGDRFAELFRAYAVVHPLPPGGSRADAQAFAAYLHDHGVATVSKPGARPVRRFLRVWR